MWDHESSVCLCVRALVSSPRAWPLVCVCVCGWNVSFFVFEFGGTLDKTAKQLQAWCPSGSGVRVRARLCVCGSFFVRFNHKHGMRDG